MVITRHSGRWTLEDRFGGPWQYLPVDVPDGTCGLRAELEYDRSSAVLDLGCIGPGGFRGWSGGARRSFVITPDEATTGQPPGGPAPGPRPAGPPTPPPPPSPRRRPAPPAASCRPARAAAGWRATCTLIPCTRTV